MLATGGESLPKSGSDGAGYEFARRAGHTIVEPTPALVPLLLAPEDTVHRDVTGMRLTYQFPVTTVMTLIPIILGAAFVAALWPAESAVRGSLMEALEYE